LRGLPVLVLNLTVYLMIQDFGNARALNKEALDWGHPSADAAEGKGQPHRAEFQEKRSASDELRVVA